MKAEFTAGGVVAVVGLLAGGFVAWKLYKLAQNAGGAALDTATRVVTQDLNPANRDNIVNRGVNAAGEAITGQDGWSLGGAIYDWLHPDAFANKPTPYLTPEQIDAARALYERPIDFGNPMGDPSGW